ncbi:hypothetical protein Pla108_36240 [Botrimarina colliarenosi]|uniref:Uncharacterized protein n=1 Tax=Botrimarina colliarenosi TaxID=2528001 RepID=A0A5C6A5Y2_9BACT|nr:hypothetical protein [Botrimarina colliarenosi]TWT94775.1 hypothetical protein Pla108_36240 [Botrimarina colliarenosi]
MSFRKVLILAAACHPYGLAGVAAGPPVELVSQAAPHGTAPQQWLQRLAEAGAGTTRLVTSGSAEPRLEELGDLRGGKSLVKVYGVLTRGGVLMLPGAEGAERFGLGDRTKLAAYFERLESQGAEAVTVPRGKYGLTEAEFTDLFTRLQTPLPKLPEGATLRDAVDVAKRAARISIKTDRSIDAVLATKAEAATSVEGLATGAALAALLRQEGLAIVGERAGLRVVTAHDVKEAWPVGYDPEGTPTQTAPGLMKFLTIEVEGYTLAEALEAIGPRVSWQDRPLPIVWDHFAMRRDGIDPATAEVKFPRRRTFYKNLLDKLASQGRLKLDLRVDEAGTPFLWLTR